MKPSERASEYKKGRVDTNVPMRTAERLEDAILIIASETEQPRASRCLGEAMNHVHSPHTRPDGTLTESKDSGQVSWILLKFEHWCIYRRENA